MAKKSSGKKVRVAIIGVGNCAKLALERGLKGALIAPSPYFKSPPQQFTNDVARLKTEEFSAGAIESGG